ENAAKATTTRYRAAAHICTGATTTLTECENLSKAARGEKPSHCRGSRRMGRGGRRDPRPHPPCPRRRPRGGRLRSGRALPLLYVRGSDRARGSGAPLDGLDIHRSASVRVPIL